MTNQNLIKPTNHSAKCEVLYQNEADVAFFRK